MVGPMGPGGAPGGIPPSAGGLGPEIPDIRKPDIQLLMQDNAQARRELFEERRHTQRRVEEERERGRYEVEKVRSELVDKLKRAERENDALITALGRLRQENDDLREEIAVLKITKVNGHSTSVPAEAPKDPPIPERSGFPTPIAVGPVGSGPYVPLMPVAEPKLGKATLLDPKH